MSQTSTLLSAVKATGKIEGITTTTTDAYLFITVKTQDLAPNKFYHVDQEIFTDDVFGLFKVKWEKCLNADVSKSTKEIRVDGYKGKKGNVLIRLIEELLWQPSLKYLSNIDRVKRTNFATEVQQEIEVLGDMIYKKFPNLLGARLKEVIIKGAAGGDVGVAGSFSCDDIIDVRKFFRNISDTSIWFHLSNFHAPGKDDDCGIFKSRGIKWEGTCNVIFLIHSYDGKGRDLNIHLTFKGGQTVKKL